MSGLHVVVLAAGMGKRMNSDRPKVLHTLAGRCLLEYVVDAAMALDPSGVHVIYGHGGEQVPSTLPDLKVNWVLQAEQLGTGHAVQQAMPGVPADARVLVLYGDVPLVDVDTLRSVTAHAEDGDFGLITVHLDDPTGYGRIIRNAAGRVVGIVEEKDASPEQRDITEVNTGIIAVPAADLGDWLPRLANDNAQGEYYLTDVVALAVEAGRTVHAVHPRSIEEVLGVNDRMQLAHLERCYQRGQAERLMRAGVALADPARLDVRGEVTAGRDVFIDVNVVLEGRVELGDGVTVGANTCIRDASIGPGTLIRPNCVIEEASTGEDCTIGPFARLRPGARLAANAHVGNYVEIKNSDVGEGSKVNHLTYVGDAQVGAGVNVGAGTITCNYDGANKFRTVIGDGAFIGSGTELVAPVEVGAGATIGAGSTITRDAPAEKLTLERARQLTVPGWKRPVKGDKP